MVSLSAPYRGRVPSALYHGHAGYRPDTAHELQRRTGTDQHLPAKHYADRFRNRLRTRNYDSFIRQQGATKFVVYVKVKKANEVVAILQALARDFGIKDAFVVGKSKAG